jgi:hypothetical protein
MFKLFAFVIWEIDVDIFHLKDTVDEVAAEELQLQLKLLVRCQGRL